MAQEAFDGGIIREIRVEGSQRIEGATVQSYLTVRPGDNFDPDKIDQSLKSLFATGLFADVSIRREGGVMLVQVVENPIINRIAFEGNKRIKTEDINPEVQLRPRTVYTRTRVQNDVERIQELYRRKGRFAARIEPKIVQLEQNRVDLIFEIEEGQMTGVQAINFVNNNVFDDDELREIMITKESRWWRFLSSNDNYDPERLRYDQEQVRRFYLRNGYADFKVLTSVAELTPDREEFFITMTVDEGKRYKFGKIEIQSEIPDIDVTPLYEAINAYSGEWYNGDKIEESITALTNRLGDLQYAFIDIDPLLERNQEDQTINLVFELKESPRVFVERVDIVGNYNTLDKVIRREMLLVEGDPFSVSKVKRSEQRIKDLGYFLDSGVEVKTAEGSSRDQSVITVEVEEQPTGEIQLGAGYSSTDGALLDFSIRQRNLLGKGQDLRLSTLLSSRSFEVDLGFTEPYFLDRDLAAGVDLFRVVRDNRDTISYDLESTGIVLRAGYPLSEKLRQRISYSLVQNKIDNIYFGSSLFLQDQLGTTITSSVESQLLYDERDSKIEPTSGFYGLWSVEFAGVGGDTRYLRNRITAGQYWEPFEEVVLGLTTEAGYIWGMGKDLRINDRFFIGGDTLRGFEIGGIGPRNVPDPNNPENSDALGGTIFSRASLELTTKLGLPDELGVKAHAFYDAGTLTAAKETPGVGDVFRDSNKVRMSAGVGVSWKSPFGPIRLDLAYPIAKEPYDQTETLKFSFGTRF
ncbi:outer membrane protein assembly factor BamA [Niveispirillum cyanobacteriorum]|uniref:Outer membrane protein assembly factor BamA n=2 Tax=Niveispirillum cyanobacteriorum TaxID=1612173 RepID=A0A2K9NF19_9PROT|nr:outer membrane protein assembly factor BamA [Niveispirillum cyanobacteriorum]